MEGPVYGNASWTRPRSPISKRRETMRKLAHTGALLSLVSVLVMLTGAEVAPPSIGGGQTACARLNGFIIGPENIGIPSGSAHVTQAEEAQLQTPQGESKSYCKVIGEIAPMTTGASPIRFEVNLPAAWNDRSLMMGGGGYDGVLVDGLGPARDAPAGE